MRVQGALKSRGFYYQIGALLAVVLLAVVVLRRRNSSSLHTNKDFADVRPMLALIRAQWCS